MNNSVDTVRQIFPADLYKRIFLVGGCVRDLLLGLANRDIDLVSTLTPADMSSLGFRPVVGVSTAPIWFRYDAAVGSIEVTLIQDAKDLPGDLARRDFTVNALAQTLDGEIIDPMHGRIDLNRHILRACTPQTFCADPLRIFRALRFETDGWAIDPDTEQLIRDRDWSDAWEAIPVERFSREMLKALSMMAPERFFQRMQEFRVGEHYFPEIFRMPCIPAGPLVHHPEGDLFAHSIQVLQRVAMQTSDPLTRFCAMFHDIGKLATAPELYPRHHGHDTTGFGMAFEFCRRLRLPAHYGKALSWISRLHGAFNLWDQLRDTTRLRIADQALKAGIVDVLPLVSAANKSGGKVPEEWRAVVTIAGMSAGELGIDLETLEQMAPSKRAVFVLDSRINKLRSNQTDQDYSS